MRAVPPKERTAQELTELLLRPEINLQGLKQAAKIAPQYWQVPDTTSLFILDGEDIITYPNIDYSDDYLPFESFTFADHMKHESRSFAITELTGPFGPFLMMLLLRDRYFPTLWPQLTN